MLDLFQPSQLQYLIDTKFPHIISNINLYKRCKSYLISLFILKSRLKLFGHVWRSDRSRINASMGLYFEETDSKRYRGRPRTIIVTTLQDDIKRLLEKMPSFSVKSLKNSVDLQRFREISQDRILRQHLLLLKFTRLLKMRNHTYVPSNRNNHKEEEEKFKVYFASFAR